MRIDRLKISNFRGIEHREIEFHPEFTLLLGENGSGKTSILSAVAVALSVFGATKLGRGWRKIEEHEVREVLTMEGERQMQPKAPQTQITATGQIGGLSKTTWTRLKKSKASNTVNVWANKAVDALGNLIQSANAHEMPLPMLAYYGAGRNWLPSNERVAVEFPDLKERREDGYYDCLNERVRTKDLLKWFVREAAARDDRGQFRQSYHAVLSALRSCIPGIENIRYDTTIQQPVITIEGKTTRFTNLSDGQRCMAATVADMAIRAVTLNSYLLPPPKKGRKVDPEIVLRETPGVVLIDELDVHLHPKWQRQVITDLRRTFPKIQFICSSHSALLIQELKANEIVRLDGAIPPDWGGENSVEDILEDVQGVDVPQQSKRATDLARATERYFKLIKQNGKVKPAEMAEAEYEYRRASEGFTTEPGLTAILKLEALAAMKTAKKKS